MNNLCKTISLNFYHPNLQNHVKDFVFQCTICQIQKQQGQGYGELALSDYCSWLRIPNKSNGGSTAHRRQLTPARNSHKLSNESFV